MAVFAANEFTNKRKLYPSRLRILHTRRVIVVICIKLQLQLLVHFDLATEAGIIILIIATEAGIIILFRTGQQLHQITVEVICQHFPKNQRPFFGPDNCVIA